MVSLGDSMKWKIEETKNTGLKKEVLDQDHMLTPEAHLLL